MSDSDDDMMRAMAAVSPTTPEPLPPLPPQQVLPGALKHMHHIQYVTSATEPSPSKCLGGVGDVAGGLKRQTQQCHIQECAPASHTPRGFVATHQRL